MKPLIIFLLALALRLCWAVYWMGDTGGVDVGRYLEQSQSLAHYHAFIYRGGISAFNAPLFPAFLSLFWTASFHPFLAQIALCVLGSLTAVLTYYLAIPLLKNKAFYAGLGAALGPMSVRYSSILLSETFFTFLVTLAIYFWSKRNWKLSGLVWGLAILTRPLPLVFIILLGLIGVSKTRRPYLIAALISLLVVAPWTIRNAYYFKRFIPVASAGMGTNLLVGTLDLDYSKSMWGQIASSGLVSESDLAGKSEVEQDKIMLRLAQERIKANPLLYVKARVKQYPLLFADFGQYAHRFIGHQPTKTFFLIGNFVFLVLSVLGLYYLRTRVLELDYLIFFPVFLVLIHLPMWVEPRYALPIVPSMAILAVVAIREISKRRLR